MIAHIFHSFCMPHNEFPIRFLHTKILSYIVSSIISFSFFKNFFNTNFVIGVWRMIFKSMNVQYISTKRKKSAKLKCRFKRTKQFLVPSFGACALVFACFFLYLFSIPLLSSFYYGSNFFPSSFSCKT